MVTAAPQGALGSAVIKRRTRVVGIFPIDAAITRLVGAVLLEPGEHWQLEGRRQLKQQRFRRSQQQSTNPGERLDESIVPIHRG
jgi:transposase-like protein